MKTRILRLLLSLAVLGAVAPASSSAQATAPTGGTEAAQPSPFALSGDGGVLLGRVVRFRGAVNRSEAGRTVAVERKDPAISPLGHATQDFAVKQGLDGDKAKEIVKAIKEQGFKVQSALQERQIRVTGKKRDELQEVIAFLRGRDFEVVLGFKNFRD